MPASGLATLPFDKSSDESWDANWVESIGLELDLESRVSLALLLGTASSRKAEEPSKWLRQTC